MFAMQRELGLDWHRDGIIKHYMKKSVLVGESEEKIIGFIAYDVSGNDQMIHSLQIADVHQNGLYGFRLLKAALKKEQVNETKNAVVACCVFENNAAQKQYYSLGFREVSRDKGVLRLEVKRRQLLERLGIE